MTNSSNLEESANSSSETAPTLKTPLDLAALTEIAKGATPGPWDHHSFGNSGSDEPETIIVHAGAFDWPAINGGDFIVSTPRWDADEDMNARHIAAFDPPTVLALLDRVKELTADLVRPDGVNPHPYYVGLHDDFPGGNDDDLVQWAFEAGAQWAAWEEQRRAQQATARAEAAEKKVAAGLAHCESAEWMTDENGDQWQVVAFGALFNALGGGE